HYCAVDSTCRERKQPGANCDPVADCEEPGCRSCVLGNCVDGFCCDKACDGQCEACDVQGSRGVCKTISGQPHGRRKSCPASPSGDICGAMACDGVDRTTCRAMVDSSVTCRAGRCINGEATARAGCDGHGACPPERSAPCAPFVCEPDGSACKAR